MSFQNQEKQIKAFFYPPQFTFEYTCTKEAVSSHLESIFNRKKTLLESNNLLGRFIDKNTFNLWIKPGVFYTNERLRWYTRLYGEVSDAHNGVVNINIKVKVGLNAYGNFFMPLIAGLLSLFTISGVGSFLFSSILLFIVIPMIIIKYNVIYAETLRQNYMTHIDNPLKNPKPNPKQ